MPTICYVGKRFHAATRLTIDRANTLCEQYADAGYDLTLRQLYYRFVANGWIKNEDTEYKKLGATVNDARLAGLIDWDHIVDRTRNVRGVRHFGEPLEVQKAAVEAWAIDKWETQPNRVEVWVEKDALVGVVGKVCMEEDVPFFSCRGYTSQSEMWSAAQRLGWYRQRGQDVVVVHLGDHDPSGLDMTRDIEERLKMFMGEDLRRTIRTVKREEGISWTGLGIGSALGWGSFTMDRIALNMDQIEQYQPPPNPAKVTDSRWAGYVDQWGRDSWELDALEPTVLAGMVKDSVDGWREDEEAWEEKVGEEEEGRRPLSRVLESWDDVGRYLVRKEEAWQGWDS